MSDLLGPILSGEPLSPAERYEVERAWRQVRNGTSAASANYGQLSVGLGAESGKLVESRRDLVEDEESDGSRNANVGDEPAE